ncbi:hypothetical protein SS50377_20594 [Spironucleus salmonicida]|uniref:Uncharacterized protein n=1 Tax=Spironucleus salmonicida TaxID=348837 RepID=V6LMK0_9EUKA|nr:hypothetical protein SS50377_28779 [Spironucleus salmonicida]KAH0577243.1 hypothetical protein SS50377_20594 [Spironucleus salmonicida]|eukprot:EST45865.1 Hypothetical protein SS50377_14151 [Spironucleus salmonicida]
MAEIDPAALAAQQLREKLPVYLQNHPLIAIFLLVVSTFACLGIPSVLCLMKIYRVPLSAFSSKQEEIVTEDSNPQIKDGQTNQEKKNE